MGAPPGALEAIMDRRNCVFVHQFMCHAQAEGGYDRHQVIAWLLIQEGMANIVAFIQEMSRFIDTRKYMLDVHAAYGNLVEGLFNA